jgi:hypothetical protein
VCTSCSSSSFQPGCDRRFASAGRAGPRVSSHDYFGIDDLFLHPATRASIQQGVDHPTAWCRHPYCATTCAVASRAQDWQQLGGRKRLQCKTYSVMIWRTLLQSVLLLVLLPVLLLLHLKTKRQNAGGPCVGGSARRGGCICTLLISSCHRQNAAIINDRVSAQLSNATGSTNYTSLRAQSASGNCSVVHFI